MTNSEDAHFEHEVLRIARAKWPTAQFCGSQIIGEKERDGVFETDEVIHFIEATTSRRADKAKGDTKKLFQLISDHQKSGSIKGAIGWFITQNEPTADQREQVKTSGKNQVKAVSFSQFQQSVVDVNSYFSCRNNHLFGSIADPVTGKYQLEDEYIPLDLLPLNNQESITLNEILDSAYNGEAFTILGEYGAGKSMTLREIYFKARINYINGKSSSFPVYINLREHSGQDDPAELLERHARKIGFERPANLVSAWRAGFVILLVDGFDEITSIGISTSRSRLKEARRRSLEAVRKLIEQTPPSIGLVVTGREHFFSSPEERNSALGLKNGTTILLGELNKAQVEKYIRKFDVTSQKVPDWLPTRPLLVAYLATRGILNQSEEVMLSIDSIDGWNILLDKICERESKISPSLDGPTLRAILERLATIARSTQDGLGPISQDQIKSAYIQICDSSPDDQANLLLQRLPGLGIYRYEDDSRTFIDLELASVCRAKDINNFIKNPYLLLQNEGWISSMRQVTSFAGKTAITSVCRFLNHEENINIESAFQAIKTASGLDVLKSDLAIICAELPIQVKVNIEIDNAVYDDYIFMPTDKEIDLSKFRFNDCIFDSIEVGDAENSKILPHFSNCLFLTVTDRTSKNDIPAEKFDEKCIYEKFSDSIKTQNSIMNANLSRGEKLVLTILRKVFIQSLGGRSETALIRGLDLNTRPLVPDAIKLLQQEGLLILFNRGDGNVWIPARKELSRVRKILGSPLNSNDPLLPQAKSLYK